MARQKKTSKVLEKATTRENSLKSISVNLDLNNGLTLKAYSQKIAGLDQALGAYNTSLSTVEDTHNEFKRCEKEVADLSERMLDGVSAKFGKDSDEYEQAGGVRKSERKRPVRKPKPKQ